MKEQYNWKGAIKEIIGAWIAFTVLAFVLLMADSTPSWVIDAIIAVTVLAFLIDSATMKPL